MKNINKIIISLIIMLFTINTIAADNEKIKSLSANITIANDYVWRGMPQHSNNKEITLSGGFDYDFNNNFSAGVWGSNVSFVDSDGNNASVEFDLYGEYAGSYKNIGYNIGYISYIFPNAKAANIAEAYFGVNYKGFSLTKYLGMKDANDNLEFSYNVNIANISTTFTYGDYDKSNKYLSIGLSKVFKDIIYTLTISNNDPINNAKKNYVVFSIGKIF